MLRPMNTKEALRSIVEPIKRGVVPIGMTAVLAVTACNGEKTNPATLVPQTPTPTVELLPKNDQLSGPEKIKKIVSLDFINEKENGKLDVVIFETERQFDFDTEAFNDIVNVIASRGGKLSTYSRVFLSDETIDPTDPSKFGTTRDRQQKFVRLSIKDGFKNNPFSSINKAYTNEAVVNGVLVGEMTNLMISVSGSLPDGAGSVERLGDSTGIMACAIFAGRSYQEYQSDFNKVVYVGPGGAIQFDKETYKYFQDNLKPALIFSK